MSTNATNTVNIPSLDLNTIHEGLKDLGEIATGGIWTKFKTHAAKAMTRPGAIGQAIGASAIILGALIKTGALAGITAILGVTCPPIAPVVLFIGGAALLTIGSIKVYQNVKAVAAEKSQANSQINTTQRKRDKALAFVKQTAENIIFGIPMVVSNFIPGARKKLEACAKTYEDKQEIYKQIFDLKNLSGKIIENIDTIKTNVTEAKNAIQNAIKEEVEKTITDVGTKIKETIRRRVESIGKEINDSVSVLLENVVNSAKIGADTLEKVKEKMKNFEETKNEVSTLIDNLTFNDGQELEEKVNTITGKVDTFVTSLLQDVAKNFSKVDLEEVVKVGARKVETKMNDFRSIG